MSEKDEGRSVQEVYETLTDEQKMLVEYLVGEAAKLGDLDSELDDYGFEISDSDEGDDEYTAMYDRLVKLINDLAVVRGKVTLSSGKEADYYIDLRRVTLHHEGADLIGSLLLEHLRELGYVPGPPDGFYDEIEGDDDSEAEPIYFSAIGGLTLGADPIATAVLHAANENFQSVDAFVVRKAAKAHGMQRQIEGPDIAGRNVIIVEDTTTTGGSPITAIEAVRAVGANPVAVATIVDRDTGAREKIEALGVPYFPLLTLDELDI